MEQAFTGEARRVQAALRLFINTGIVVRNTFRDDYSPLNAVVLMYRRIKLAHSRFTGNLMILVRHGPLKSVGWLEG
jgi:hypothetical protein